MGDLKLFRVEATEARELEGSTAPIEKSLQTTMERHLATLLGVRFLASEYSTGKKHGGRIDTLGLDENNSPVIIEYKRRSDENVMSQGLFYLNWLLDHRGEFQLLVTKVLGPAVAESIDWQNPRLICVAGGFTRYDEYAVQEINRSIDLVRYRLFPENLMALELVSSRTVSPPEEETTSGGAVSRSTGRSPSTKTVSQYLESAPEGLRELFFDLERSLEALGDDVTKKVTQLYFAFRRIKNFACVEVHPQTQELLVYLKVDPDSVQPMPDFARDVRKIGHFGTGDLELRIKNAEDLAQAQDLLRRSYEGA